MNPFSHFHFEGQHEKEQILRIMHRHWFYIFFQFLLIVLALVLVVGSFLFIMWYFPELLAAVTYQAALFFETMFLLFVWFYAFFLWIDYYLDVWIVTDERIINIEQKGLFIREISELELSNIQDVTTEVTGFIPTMLNFGKVFVQTAAEKERFIFEDIPDPYAVKGLIMQLARKAKKQDNGVK